MASKLTDVTLEHDEIRRWAEERGGKPAVVSASREDDREGGLLRIDFPGYSGEDALEEIEWDEFFAIFDDDRLAFLRQDRTRDGEMSRFNKFISRDALDEGDVEE